MTTMTPALASAHLTVPKAAYNYAIGYLRAFIGALVIAHHAALAYHPFAPAPPSVAHRPTAVVAGVSRS